MLGYIKGRVLSLILDTEKYYLATITPELSSSIGYNVFVSAYAIKRLSLKEKDIIELFIYTYLTQNEQIYIGITELYRYKIFLRLIRISGVGPKLAGNIVEFYNDHRTLMDIFANQDVQKLKQVPGLGAKKASRILLNFVDASDIADFVKRSTSVNNPADGTKLPKEFLPLQELLVRLGLSYKEAKRLIASNIDILEKELKAYRNLGKLDYKSIDYGKLLSILLRVSKN